LYTSVMNLPLTTPTLSTPIAAYGIADVSRPMAAALLGVSVKALNGQIAGGQITAAGRAHKHLAIAEIEALTGRPVTVHDYLTSLTRHHRRTEGQRRDGSPGMSLDARAP
jgi:hypothetical protein